MRLSGCSGHIQLKLLCGRSPELLTLAAHLLWINHSMRPTKIADTNFPATIGGNDYGQPYASSLLNVSVMSFRSLSANAIRALNKGAKLGEFAHDTGEGSISRYHREVEYQLGWIAYRRRVELLDASSHTFDPQP
jgi:hypothetical protein